MQVALSVIWREITTVVSSLIKIVPLKKSVVKSLIDNPEKLVITTEEEGEVLKIFIKADENDIGKRYNTILTW